VTRNITLSALRALVCRTPPSGGCDRGELPDVMLASVVGDRSGRRADWATWCSPWTATDRCSSVPTC
jgi:hypothetical protein